MSHNGLTFLTNHAHILLCLAQDPSQRIRDLAWRLGLTERAVQLMLNELVAEGYLEKQRVGRRNQYRLVRHRPMRHAVERHCSIGELLGLFPTGAAMENGIARASRPAHDEQRASPGLGSPAAGGRGAPPGEG